MMLSSDDIKKTAVDLGADAVGIAKAGPVAAKDKFLGWLYKGYAGEMDYLKRNLDLRFDPGRLLPKARSVIVIGLNYRPTPDDLAQEQSPYKAAWYGWGEDYHDVIRRKLKGLRSGLRKTAPRLRGRICVDTAPFMDKYWAQRAGIGWVGKHSNLVSRQFGSWLVLGSLIIDHEVDGYDEPHADYCGRCTACIDSCPSGAIGAPYELDATKCISYWTIESKGEKIPEEISLKMAKWVFGCDICLKACPFNRFEKPRREKAFERRGELALIETGKVAGISADEFANLFSDSPLSRPGLSGLARNILACRR
jgi:epoxyqueuosine reductase